MACRWPRPQPSGPCLDGNLQLPIESVFVASAYANRDGNCNANSTLNAQADSHSETGSHSAAASYTGPSAINLGAYTKLSTGTREAIREFPKSRKDFISE